MKARMAIHKAAISTNACVIILCPNMIQDHAPFSNDGSERCECLRIDFVV